LPLDSSIFMQYAQLKQRQNENLQNSIGGAVDDYTKAKENKGFDLKKLAETAVLKSEMGVKPSADEEAAFNAYQKMQSAELGWDAYSGQPYQKYQPFGLGGGSAPSGGLDFKALGQTGGFVPPKVQASVEAQMPDSFIGGVNDAVGQAPAPAVPLNVSQLQPAYDPTIDADRAAAFERNQAMVQGDALPVVGSTNSGEFLPEVAPKMGGFDMNNLPNPYQPVTAANNLRIDPAAKAQMGRKAVEMEASANMELDKKRAEANIEIEKEGAKNAQSKATKISSLSSAIDSIDAISEIAPNAPSGRLEGFAASVANEAGYPTDKSIGQADLEPKIELLTTALKDYIRSPGEGTWTDADQRKLDRLAPDENDSTPVKLKKLQSLKEEFVRLQGGKKTDFTGFKYLGTED
jgi:hypothetical protein